jgi:hypothetical protein
MLHVALRFKLFALALFGISLGTGGCACNPDTETCIYIRAYAVQLAAQATLCCNSPDPAACLQQVRESEETIAKHIEEMRKACRDENWQRLRELKDLLPSIMPKWFKPPAETTPTPPTSPAPPAPPTPGEGGQKNAFAAFAAGETVTLSASATVTGTPTPLSTVVVNGQTYLPSATGSVVVQTQAEEGETFSIAEAVPEQSPTSLMSMTYSISSGATLTLNTTLGQIAYSVSGSFGLSSGMSWSNSTRCLVTEVSLTLERGEARTKVGVDLSHPNNMLVYNPQTGHGYLRFMATLSTVTNDGASFSPIPKVWIEIPMIRSTVNGSIDFAAAGAMQGTDFSPAVPLPQALISQSPLPTEYASVTSAPDCLDSDGDGIPNVAEALYDIYRTGFPGCGLIPLGSQPQ